MPLSRDPDRTEQTNSGPNNRLYRLRELIRQDGPWGDETKVVLLRWNGTKWELWRDPDPITTSSVEESNNLRGRTPASGDGEEPSAGKRG